MTTETKEIEKVKSGPLATIQNYLDDDGVKARLEKMLGDNSDAFANSVLNVVGSDKNLKAIAQNNPNSIMRECMKAAAMKMPIDKALGWAALVPFKNDAQLVIMYRGWIQLCIRSGLYKHINCTEVYDDEIEFYNPITGDVSFKDPKEYKVRYTPERYDHVVGHYIFFKLKTGFEHAGYISHQEALAHAKRYSMAYQYDLKSGKKTSAWSTNPIEMGNKTIILRELKRYGAMSIEMQDALVADRETFEEAQANAAKRIESEQGSEPIDANFEENGEPERDAETQAKIDKQKAALAESEKGKGKKTKKAVKKSAKKKDKGQPKPYICDGCNQTWTGDEIKEDNKGLQCPKCFSRKVRRNTTGEDLPDFMKDDEAA
jgi:recombination protein RecT